MRMQLREAISSRLGKGCSAKRGFWSSLSAQWPRSIPCILCTPVEWLPTSQWLCTIQQLQVSFVDEHHDEYQELSMQRIDGG